MLFNWRACDLNGDGTNLLSTLEESCINFFNTLTAWETLKSVRGGPSIPALTLSQPAPFHSFPGSSISSLPLQVEERQEPPYPPCRLGKVLAPLSYEESLSPHSSHILDAAQCLLFLRLPFQLHTFRAFCFLVTVNLSHHVQQLFLSLSQDSTSRLSN